MASPHPPNFAEPELHGIESLLQDPAEGQCQECHGDDLDGGSASTCNDCHADAGAEDWLTNCAFCHGNDATGTPPVDIDQTSDPDAISFRAHNAHVQGGGEYPELNCVECHVDTDHALDPGHWFDATPGVSEVVAIDGHDPQMQWTAGSCSDSYCHGTGYRSDGEVVDDLQPMNCDSCHVSNSPQEMSGLHALHLDDSAIGCADCHDDSMDTSGLVDVPELHLDGALQLSFSEPTIQEVDGTCVGSCHGVEHDGSGWGHLPGYDAPEVHGIDANLQSDDCGLCHGADWAGGTAIGCDDCHTQEGHADWRTDCTFCHGGDQGDLQGLPPRDMNGEGDEALISFQSHPEHDAQGSIGHPTYGCETCHTMPDMALSLGHAVDGTPAAAEVDFFGLALGSSMTGGTCVTWCHGDGVADGTINDNSTPLTCDSCHQSSSPFTGLSGTHDTHLGVAGVTCADCHDPVVDASNIITSPNLHVDGLLDLDASSTGFNPGTETCAISCHGKDHSGLGWQGGHPPGYEEPEAHGTEALLNTQLCTGCHGADLQGGTSGQGCDDCHTSGWQQDCTYCHGGQNGDTEGLPPEDLNNETNASQISFMAHPEHGESSTHPSYACVTCHDSAGYSDALLDVGHWLDGTPGVSEVDFAGANPAGGTYAGTTCSNIYCHGNGQDVGTVSDSTSGLSCDGCHQASSPYTALSGTHATHMNEAGVSCADCHSPVVDSSNAITSPDQHVDGTLDLDAASTGYNPGSETCTVSCHSHDHTNSGWEGGHPPGYEAAEQHGTESLLGTSDCTACHGADLQGGTSGQGCDDCHTSGWQQDCTYCHGGQNGDTEGLPPEDINNETNASQISFMAHPEHGESGTHPSYACTTCHDSAGYSDALLDVGHWLDGTPGVSEVDFAGAVQSGGTYSGTTCSNIYCHGNGQDVGTVSDSTSALNCDGCHQASSPYTDLSGTHYTHMNEAGVSCADCHSPVVDSSNVITSPNLHVDGNLDVDTASTGFNAVAETCTISCHSHDHTGTSWFGGHPAGYDAPEEHGTDSLMGTSDCMACHGTDLLGGSSGQGCDDCHTAGWRQDCTYCHGGQNGDTEGLPPEDLDNESNEASISFRSHPEHNELSTHPSYGCENCHDSQGYSDALLDAGHWFDASPGVAEVSFDGAVQSGGTYSGTTCSNIYCHGNGQGTGTVSDGTTGFACDDCHADEGSGGDAWDDMSGEHKKHLEEGYACEECHSTVVNGAQSIIDPSLHVDGEPTVFMLPSTSSLTWNGSTCNGSCHGENHNDGW